jgi:hypothetical protein
LNEDGILHQFVANTEAAIVAAATRAILNSFPHVRIYRSYNGWGHHFIASEKPLQRPDLLEAVAKMPESARNDFIEWAQGQSISEVVSRVFANEVSAEELMVDFPQVTITDDRPVNEYYFLRRLRAILTEGHVRYRQ